MAERLDFQSVPIPEHRGGERLYETMEGDENIQKTGSPLNYKFNLLLTCPVEVLRYEIPSALRWRIHGHDTERGHLGTSAAYWMAGFTLTPEEVLTFSMRFHG